MLTVFDLMILRAGFFCLQDSHFYLKQDQKRLKYMKIIAASLYK